MTAEGRSAIVSDAVFSPARVVAHRARIRRCAPASRRSSTFRTRARSRAARYPEGGGIVCTKGDDFSYFAHQSVIPYIFDPDDAQSAQLDAMTRDIVLRVPAGIDVVATGEKVSETLEATTKVSTWTIDHPLSRALGMYVFAGKLGLKTVPGRSVPTTFVFPNPEMPVDGRLVSWSAGVLDFVEKLGGGPLPFQRSLTLVRLPANVGDPGTATFGMTLLSESYARAGDLMHEETWAHENSHLFWGIVVPEASSAESRMMSEGLATLARDRLHVGAPLRGRRSRHVSRAALRADRPRSARAGQGLPPDPARRQARRSPTASARRSTRCGRTTRRRRRSITFVSRSVTTPSRAGSSRT